MSQIALNSNSSSINGTNSLQRQQISTPNSPRDFPNGVGSVVSPAATGLSSSGYFTVDITVQTRFKNNYQLAIKQYLNRNFGRAWSIVSPLIDEILNDRTTKNNKISELGKDKIDDELIIKIYKLYLSLIDLILKEARVGNNSLAKLVTPQTTNFPLLLGSETNECNELYDQFMDGLLFDQIQEIHFNNFMSIDPELLLMCFIIELSNGFSLIELNNQVEKYLTEIYVLPNGEGLMADESSNNNNNNDNDVTKKEKLVEFYLLHVLTKLNQVAKSKTLIRKLFVTDDVKVETYLKNLESAIKNNQIEEQQRTQRLVERYEEEQEEQQQVDQMNNNNDTLFKNDSPTHKNKKMKKVKKKSSKRPNSGTSKDLSKFGANNDSDTVPPASNSKNQLIEIFKSYLLPKSYNNNNIYSNIVKQGIVLVFLVSLLVSISHKKIRFRNFLVWLLNKLKETLGMAFKISYV